MGLTIHYEQKDKKLYLSEQNIQQCIEFVEEVARREKWKIIKERNETIDPSIYRGNWRNEPKRSKRTETHLLGIIVLPHKDCESLEFNFDVGAGKLLFYNDFGAQKYRSWSTFCKTHYAGFLVHKKVCKLLNAIDKHFVPLQVQDEGDYYGNWNDEQGKKNFGEYVAFVHDFGKKLNAEFGKDGVNVINAEDYTNGWKGDYIEHLAREKRKEENEKT